MSADETAKRPVGRPRGRKNNKTLLLEEIMLNLWGPATELVGEKIKDGNLVAAQTVIEWLRRRGKAAVLELPEINSAADIETAQAELWNAVNCGEITIADGQSLAAILDGHRRAIETSALERRLHGLEEKQALADRIDDVLATVKR